MLSYEFKVLQMKEFKFKILREKEELVINFSHCFETQGALLANMSVGQRLNSHKNYSYNAMESHIIAQNGLQFCLARIPDGFRPDVFPENTISGIYFCFDKFEQSEIYKKVHQFRRKRFVSWVTNPLLVDVISNYDMKIKRPIKSSLILNGQSIVETLDIFLNAFDHKLTQSHGFVEICEEKGYTRDMLDLAYENIMEVKNRYESIND